MKQAPKQSLLVGAKVNDEMFASRSVINYAASSRPQRDVGARSGEIFCPMMTKLKMLVNKTYIYKR